MPARPGGRRRPPPTRLLVQGLRTHAVRRRGALAVVVVCLAVGAGTPLWTDRRAAARHPVTGADLARARAELDGLTVRGRDPVEPYERSAFGQAWADTDRNGCDTRNDVLRRDLADVTLDPATRGCVVLTGRLDDPYTGRIVLFARGPDSRDVQIDHVVALGDAWRSGAAGWSTAERTGFANDPANLLAVEGDANEDKGAADAAAWLPPEPGYRCAYAVRQVRVKAAYRLGVSTEERAALGRALDGCVVAAARLPPRSDPGVTPAADPRATHRPRRGRRGTRAAAARPTAARAGA